MSLWVLDTDTLSLFQREHPLVSQRVNATPSEQLATTVITLEEQMYGRLNRIRRANSQEALVLAYTQLRETLEDFKTNVLEFNQDAANCYSSPKSFVKSSLFFLCALCVFVVRLRKVFFTNQIGLLYAEFLRQKVHIGTQDLRIAAIVISNDGVLVTRNQKDFSRVPGLRVEDWTVGD